MTTRRDFLASLAALLAAPLAAFLPKRKPEPWRIDTADEARKTAGAMLADLREPEWVPGYPANVSFSGWYDPNQYGQITVLQAVDGMARQNGYRAVYEDGKLVLKLWAP